MVPVSLNHIDRLELLNKEPPKVFSFILGATLSALSGWLGMSVATLGNVRTTVACTGTPEKPGTLNDGLKVRRA